MTTSPHRTGRARLLGLSVLLAIVLIAAGCSSSSDSDGDGEAAADSSSTTEAAEPVVADRILINGAVYTVDDDLPRAEAVALAGDTIVFVGDSDTAVEQWAGPDTEVVDLGGAMVLPGFIDTHAHPLQAAGLSDALILEGGSVEDTLAAVAAYEETNDLPYLLGFGFDETQFLPDGPRKETLDEVVPDKPVILVDAGGHSAWVNTAALDAFGIGADTPDPLPGKHYFQRDADGEPTGWLVESQAYGPYLAELGVFDADAVADRSNPVYGLFASFGVTTVFDAGAASYEDQALEAVAALRDGDGMPVRLVASHMIQHPDQVADAVDRYRELDETYSGGLFTMGAIKVHNDGTTEALTAAMLEPFAADPDNDGAVLLEADQLTDVLLQADAAGIDVHIHTIGDRAIREALDAVETMRDENPDSTMRPTLAHVELIDEADRDRFGELDVIVQTTPYWWTFPGDASLLGPERAQQIYTYDDVVEASALITYGSDFPATGGPLFAAGPLWGIESGITRSEPALGTPPYRPDTAFDLEAMIRGYTIDAAYQLRLEDQIGSLEAGKSADLVILERDLFEIDPTEIHTTPVVATMLAGEPTYGTLPGSG